MITGNRAHDNYLKAEAAAKERVMELFRKGGKLSMKELKELQRLIEQYGLYDIIFL